MNQGSETRVPKPSPDSVGEPMLEALGISNEAELLYRELLREPGQSLSRLARSLKFTPAKASRLVASLEDKGLVSRVPGRQRDLLAAPPGVAIEALVRGRQQEFERIRVEASSALEEFRRQGSSTDTSAMVELVEGPEAIYQRFLQVERAAREQVVVFDRPPYAKFGVNDPELELLGQGVRFRVLYDRQAIEYPGQLDTVRRFTAAGEEARVIDHLPMKLIIADRRLGIVPLFVNDPAARQLRVHEALLVHSSALLDSLADSFETLWQRGVPIPAPGQIEQATGSYGISAEDEKVLTYLAAGLKDEVIARRLGIAPRTAQRRVARLMDLLGAETRFQAGLQAAKLGWL